MPAAGLIGEATIDYAIKATCRHAGVKPPHWHELRHHYASVLIAGGENPKVVQMRLGHKDVMTTMRTYSHLFAAAEEKTRDVLDAAWALPGETAEEGRTDSSAKGGRFPESRRSDAVVSQLKG